MPAHARRRRSFSAVAALIVALAAMVPFVGYPLAPGRDLPRAAQPRVAAASATRDCGSSADGSRPRNVARLATRACWRTARSASSSSSASSAPPASSSTSSCSRSACASSTCTTGWPTSIAFAVAVSNNFFWNRLWTFRHQRDDSHVAMQGARFFAVSLLAATAGFVLLEAFVRAGLPKIPAEMLAVIAGGADLVPRQQALVVPLARHAGGCCPGRAARARRAARGRARRRLRAEAIVDRQVAARRPLAPALAPEARASRRAARGRTGSCSRARRSRRRRSRAG